MLPAVRLSRNGPAESAPRGELHDSETLCHQSRSITLMVLAPQHEAQVSEFSAFLAVHSLAIRAGRIRNLQHGMAFGRRNRSVFNCDSTQ